MSVVKQLSSDITHFFSGIIRCLVLIFRPGLLFEIYAPQIYEVFFQKHTETIENVNK